MELILLNNGALLNRKWSILAFYKLTFIYSIQFNSKINLMKLGPTVVGVKYTLGLNPLWTFSPLYCLSFPVDKTSPVIIPALEVRLQWYWVIKAKDSIVLGSQKGFCNGYKWEAMFNARSCTACGSRASQVLKHFYLQVFLSPYNALAWLGEGHVGLWKIQQSGHVGGQGWSPCYLWQLPLYRIDLLIFFVMHLAVSCIYPCTLPRTFRMHMTNYNLI